MDALSSRNSPKPHLPFYLGQLHSFTTCGLLASHQLSWGTSSTLTGILQPSQPVFFGKYRLRFHAAMPYPITLHRHGLRAPRTLQLRSHAKFCSSAQEGRLEHHGHFHHVFRLWRFCLWRLPLHRCHPPKHRSFLPSIPGCCPTSSHTQPALHLHVGPIRPTRKRTLLFTT